MGFFFQILKFSEKNLVNGIKAFCVEIKAKK